MTKKKVTQVELVDSQGSPAGTLNSTDAYKTVRGFAITLIAALVTAVSSVYLNWDYQWAINGRIFDLTWIAIPVIGALIELGRRYATSTQ